MKIKCFIGLHWWVIQPKYKECYFCGKIKELSKNKEK